MRMLILLLAVVIFVADSGCQSKPQPVTLKVTMKKYSISPNEIRVKQGQPVTLEVSTADVQHGFQVEGLKIDEPIQPRKPAVITFTPAQKGEYKMECDIICGPHHDDMQGKIIVE
jgi:cytochrome c oxidase subunit II